MNAYDLVSVYMFDREYRRLQHAHKFRWGTVVGHLSAQHLRLRQSKEYVGNAKNSRQNNAFNQSKLVSHSLEGKPICRKYNGRGGCSLAECRYMHVCNVPGCNREHPSASHADHATKKLAGWSSGGLCLSAWEHELGDDFDKEYILTGVREGFHIIDD